MVKRLTALLLCLMALTLGAAAQQREVSGRVTSAEDSEPLMGASVMVKGTRIGVTTDMDGKFVINNVPASATTLVVTYVGMAT